MTNDNSGLCTVVMKDLLALHRSRQCLAAVHEGITQTNLSGKPAMLAMLDQVDDEICALIKKASPRAIANGLKGHYQRYDIPQALIEYMAGFAPTPAERGVQTRKLRHKVRKLQRLAASNGQEQAS